MTEPQHPENQWDAAIANLSTENWETITNLNARIAEFSGNWSEDYRNYQNGLIHEFVKTWYELELVVPFAWAEWDEGRDWYQSSDEDKYASLTPEFCLKLITAIIRNDRFNEGALERVFLDGDFPKIINRFVEIAKDQ